MRKWIVSFLFIILASASVYSENFGNSRIVVGPYLQNMNENGVEIIWKTDSLTSENEVKWGASPDFGNTTQAKSYGKFHSARLNRMEYSRNYFYRVISDGFESNLYKFYFPSPEDFKFIVYGDSRGIWDNWKNATLIAHAIEKERIPLVFNTGDMVKNGERKEEWEKFMEIAVFMHNSSLYASIGNHDIPYIYFKKYFYLPGNERWYSFDYGEVHFTILNSNSPLSILQLLWLEKDLSTEKMWKIVIFHHPPYSSGSHGSSEIIRKIFVPVFERKKVDIVFSGHDHVYERAFVGNITYIVTGGGGAPLYNAGRSEWTVYSESVYHYCRISVNKSSLLFQAVKTDGEIFDSFYMEKNITKIDYPFKNYIFIFGRKIIPF